jgi:hypothetical protein
MHLKDDPRTVADSEQDLATGQPPNRHYPIEPERLQVFRTDADIPKDELNTSIDRHFVAAAQVLPPRAGGFEAWRTSLREELRRVTFRCFPERIPAARLIAQIQPDDARLESEPGIEVGLKLITASKPATEVKRVLLIVRNPESTASIPDWLQRVQEVGDEMYLCAPRGVDRTRWTRKNPPNYVERAHVLLGRTVDTGRVWDIAATAQYLHAKDAGKVPVYVLGEGPAGVLAAYAALWEPQIAGAILNKPPLGHMEPDAPALLNVIRVCDIPDVLGMLAPRPLVIYSDRAGTLEKVAAIYATAGEPRKFTSGPTK